MKEQKTIYHLIVDKSGSMSDCIDNTIIGINEQLTRILKMGIEFPKHEITLGLTTFNDLVSHHYFQENPLMVKKMEEHSYVPGGCTALLDAIGSTIKIIEREVAMSNLKIPTTVVVVIITDGHENASQEYNFKLISQMIRNLEATQKWIFNFIGATFDTSEVAEKLSIKNENIVSFTKDEMKEEVWDKLSNSMNSYLVKKQSGKNPSNFLED